MTRPDLHIIGGLDYSSPAYPPRFVSHIDASELARILEGQFNEPAIVRAQREHEAAESVANDAAWVVGFLAFALLFAGVAVWL